MRRAQVNCSLLWFVCVSLVLCIVTLWQWEEQPVHAYPSPDPYKSSSSKQRVLCVVGVQTGFQKKGVSQQYDYASRRAALRSSWFPRSREALAGLTQEHGLVVRFVIGHTREAQQEAALALEEGSYGGFLRLAIQEGYASLTTKTLTFLSVATELYDAEYIVKVDDDVYLRLDRIQPAILQWRHLGADYIGCMKNGDVYSDPKYRWFERQWPLLGKTYFTHAWGTLYVISGQAASSLAGLPSGALRFFTNEDVTVGSWMLAFNVTHYDDRRLCEPSCSPTSIGVYDMPRCAGLCDPISALPALHASEACQPAAQTELPMLPAYFKFPANKARQAAWRRR